MKKIILFAIVAVLSCSCSIYRKYQRPSDLPVDSLYTEEMTAGQTEADSSSLAYMSWQEIFADPCLQDLIGKALDNNVDLQSAILRVESAKAMLNASKWAYAPSLAIAPQAGLSSVNAGKASWTYNLPVSASWDVDLFGSLLNAKRGAQATMLQQDAYRQAVRSQLIAGVANSYYALLMLDEQVKVSNASVNIWKEQLRTMEAMYKVGLATENAVTQSRANLYALEASLAQLVRQQQETENGICTLLGLAPFEIERRTLSEQEPAENLKTGLPVELLSNRPDVRAAEMALASAYYTTNQARSAFYPKLNLSGSAGWTNNLGQAVSNPAAWILSALGKLTMPVFNHGKLTANLKVSKNEEEIARMNYKQALLEAGQEVNDALFAIETAGQMLEKHQAQCADLERTVKTSEQLYKNASGTYLEILTARQSLLNAQLNAISDRYQLLTSTVALYQALGGGR